MPTTQLVLSHKHPDDYVQVAATLDEIRRTHRNFSTRHRIIDEQQMVRDVIGPHGFYVDVTDDGRSRADFELLKWRSQESNVKLRVLAEQVLFDFGQLIYEEVLPPRATFDHVLLTAHLRVGTTEAESKTAS